MPTAGRRPGVQGRSPCQDSLSKAKTWLATNLMAQASPHHTALSRAPQPPRDGAAITGQVWDKSASKAERTRHECATTVGHVWHTTDTRGAHLPL